MNISGNSAEYAEKVQQILKKQGFRAEVDLRNEKITFKIREHAMQKVPYLIVVGDKEAEANAVAVRARGGVDLGVMPIEDFIARLQQDVSQKVGPQPVWGEQGLVKKFWRKHEIATEKTHRINREITAPELRLIGNDSEPLGVVKLADALRLAEESELDLVEIAPTAEPPVARVMDYGKFKYQEAKKAHEAKLKQKVIQVKEVKFRPGTDDGDYNVKLRNLVRFLEEGDKTKITLRFRGRELAHQEIGVRMLERLKADLEPYGAVEQFPKMEGRQMVMVLSPVKKK